MPFRMSDEVLEAYIRQLLDAQRGPETVVAWQGGEPTLMGLEFFEHAIALVERYRRPNQSVSHTIQTNGTRLNDAWCAFFKRHHFLVGLSVDGPKALHDAFRVDKGGGGSFLEVMRGWQLLQAHRVDVNLLCSVHAANGDDPLEVYRFFRDTLGASFIQFIPIVERATDQTIGQVNRGWGENVRLEPGATNDLRPLYTQAGARVSRRSVRPAQFGRFLCAVFDEWVRRDVGKVFVQAFDVALASWLGQHTLCTFSPTCGESVALEHNGDLYSCDHYVEPGYLLENILQTPIAEMVASEKQRAFGQRKYDSLPQYCRTCEVLTACYGECPRNRFVETPDGEPGLNCLCEGYKAFFTHIAEPMGVMAELLRNARPPQEVMEWCAAREMSRAGRNDPCPCGSGRKFKRCHGATA
jgi:uncharacterized protein